METQLINKTETSDRFSTYLAIGSFCIGTLLFLIHLILPKFGLLYLIGYFYLILAFLANLFVFLYLLFQFFVQPKEREALTVKMLIMLANIPIALLYLYIVFYKF